MAPSPRHSAELLGGVLEQRLNRIGTAAIEDAEIPPRRTGLYSHTFCPRRTLTEYLEPTARWPSPRSDSQKSACAWLSWEAICTG